MDPTIEALRRLLRATPQRPGGDPQRRKMVAERAGVSPDNLYQVCKQIKLESGRPRMLGRDVRERLDAAFPGWADENPQHRTAEPAPVYQNPPPLRASLPVVLGALTALPPTRWASVRAQLDMLVTHPELLDDVLAELNLLLAQAPGKRQARG